MTTLFRKVLVVSLAGIIVSCGLFKKKDDGADAAAEAAVAEVAEAAPPPVATPAATNENDISRFPDEKKLENVTGTIQRTTNVREIPGIGKVVIQLAKGGTVTEIAQRGTFFLVVFQSPKDQKQLMGWVSQESFTAPVDAGLRILTCTLPEQPLISDTPFCGKVCTADTDCPAGQACKGAANKFAAGVLGAAVTVCTFFTAPAPKPVVVDAAAPPPPPPPPPPPVKCPAGQVFVAQDKACHQGPCKIGGCPTAQPLCIACSGTFVCVGVAQRQLCK